MTNSEAHPIIIVALEDELPQHLLPEWEIVYCGIGKINAAMAVSRLLATQRPSRLINFGTAGGITQTPGTLVRVGHVIQRDMDLTGLGIARGTTAFDTVPAMLSLDDSPIICGTGDNFLQGPPEMACDIVDMELFAIAKICAVNDIPLTAYKYISDAANDAAAGDWREALSRAATAFCHRLSSETL